MRRIADAKNMSKLDLCREALGTDQDVDFALPQEWLNGVADKLEGRFTYDQIRVSFVTDYRGNCFGKMTPITIEGEEILAALA